MADPLPSALVIHANHYRFQAGESISRRTVYSRMQLWCHSGSGVVSVNGRRYPMHSGSLLIMPWKHDVSYHADRQQPFYVSGVHLIPHCDPPATIPWFQTPHRADDPLCQADWFADRGLPGLEEVLAVTLQHEHPLFQLGSCMVSMLNRPTIDESSVRHATQVLLHEWIQLAAAPLPHQSLPRGLERVCQHINSNLHRSLSLQDCARLAACSVATLHRLSHRHLGSSLLQWQRQQQLQRARELLRSSTRTIQDIAQDCGFSDPLYFSRLFKQAFSLSPRAWRQQYAMT